MDSRVRDIRGQKFGKLTVLERVADSVTKSGKKLVTWKCKCDCGKECIVKSTNLKSGNTTSCGCVREKLRHQKRDLIPNKNAQNFIGKRFVFLKVEEEIKPYRDPVGRKIRKFRCKCICGKYRDVRIDLLRDHVIISCGCITPKKYKKIFGQEIDCKRKKNK